MRLVVGTRDTLPTADEDRRWVLDGLRAVADALFDLAEPCHPVPHLVDGGSVRQTTVLQVDEGGAARKRSWIVPRLDRPSRWRHHHTSHRSDDHDNGDSHGRAQRSGPRSNSPQCGRDKSPSWWTTLADRGLPHNHHKPRLAGYKLAPIRK